MQQMPLGVQLRDSAVFATFVARGNEEAVAFLESLPSPTIPSVWLWGKAGSGRTHLLQATCAHFREAGRQAAYLPLTELMALGPGVLEGWDSAALVAVDDAGLVAGRADWEQALFRLFNGVSEAGGMMAFAAESAPAGLQTGLADLASRLSWGVVFQLRELDDASRREALMLRAAQRGFRLPEETADYLLHRLPRDMGTLLAWLDRLDKASLAAQRRLTVPFVRTLLGTGRVRGPAGVSEATDNGDE